MNDSRVRSVTDGGGRLAWSVDELTATLGVSQGFLRKLIRSKKLPHKKLGRRVLILDRDLQEFLSTPETLA
jgi:excisionase family DNA binding protein